MSAAKYHAHFDCFSGAAGDMMLASCLDAAEDPNKLLDQIVNSIRRGLPAMASEFDVSFQKVWKGSGSIRALYLTVDSTYRHQPAPPPVAGPVDGSSHSHEHHHSHDHEHNHSHGSDQHHDVASLWNETECQSSCETESGIPKRNDPHAGTETSRHRHSRITGPLRNLPEIRSMLQAAPEEYIPQNVRDTAIAAFTELALAEASVHGSDSIETVHFHEVGAVDSIVDMVGTLLALHFLNVETVSCSALPLSEGSVWTAHGLLPVPAPATLYLMKGMRTTPGPPGVTGELVTPTAAALLRVLSRSSPDQLPRFTIRKVGTGAGTKEFRNHPNILRLIIGDKYS